MYCFSASSQYNSLINSILYSATPKRPPSLSITLMMMVQVVQVVVKKDLESENGDVKTFNLSWPTKAFRFKGNNHLQEGDNVLWCKIFWSFWCKYLNFDCERTIYILEKCSTVECRNAWHHNEVGLNSQSPFHAHSIWHKLIIGIIGGVMSADLQPR